MLRSRFLVAATLVAGLFLGLAASPADAAGYYWRHFVGVGSNRCLDVDTNSNTIVQLWSCDSGTDESWRVEYAATLNGTLDYYEIINRRTNFCLSIAGDSGVATAAAVMVPCGNATTSKYWYFPIKTGPTTTIVNFASNMYLDVRNNGTSNGSVVQQYYGNGTSAQLWTDVAV